MIHIMLLEFVRKKGWPKVHAMPCAGDENTQTWKRAEPGATHGIAQAIPSGVGGRFYAEGSLFGLRSTFRSTITSSPLRVSGMARRSGLQAHPFCPLSDQGRVGIPRVALLGRARRGRFRQATMPKSRMVLYLRGLRPSPSFYRFLVRVCPIRSDVMGRSRILAPDARAMAFATAGAAMVVAGSPESTG